MLRSLVGSEMCIRDRDLVAREIDTGQCRQIEERHADDLAEFISRQINDRQTGVGEGADVQPRQGVVGEINVAEVGQVFQQVAWETVDLIVR